MKSIENGTETGIVSIPRYRLLYRIDSKGKGTHPYACDSLTINVNYLQLLGRESGLRACFTLEHHQRSSYESRHRVHLCPVWNIHVTIICMEYNVLFPPFILL